MRTKFCTLRNYNPTERARTQTRSSFVFNNSSMILPHPQEAIHFSTKLSSDEASGSIFIE
jgi:hypothetical protein